MRTLFTLSFLLLLTTMNVSASKDLKYAASMGFIENKGQIAHRHEGKLRPDIKFKLEASGVNSYFKKDGIENYFYKQSEVPEARWTAEMLKRKKLGYSVEPKFDMYFYRMDVNFLNANKEVQLQASNPHENVRNYYYEICPDGLLGVKEYGEITYVNIYNNIDLKYYSKDGNAKYDFILHKGANIKDIKLQLVGATNLKIDKGALVYNADFKELREEKPYSFYATNGKEIVIDYAIDKTKNIISFSAPQNTFDADVVIDPALAWSTFFPGVYGGYQGDPCVDSQGNIYIATGELSGNNFPVLNAGSGQWFQDSSTASISGGIYAPNIDIVVFKFDAGYNLKWATYYGGQNYENTFGKRNVAIDEVNNSIYIVGRTEKVFSNGAQTLPTFDPGGGAFYQDVSYGANSSCPFFLKFSSTGVRQWATLFNYETGPWFGSMIDFGISSIYFRNGNLYFAGGANPNGHSGAPLRTLAGAYNNSFTTGYDNPMVGRFNSNCNLEWCTYVNAGVPSSNIFVSVVDMVVDKSNNIYLVSDYNEWSPAPSDLIMPLVNPGGGAYYKATATFEGTAKRGTHITKLNPSSSSVLWGTFFNGSTSSGAAPGFSPVVDHPWACDVDTAGNFSFSGLAGTTDFPTLNPGGGAFYQATKASANGYGDGTITKFSPSGVLQWSTYVNGTTPNTEHTTINDIDFYPNGDIMVSGATPATDFPILGVVGSYNLSLHPSVGLAANVFMKFSSTNNLVWSSYFPVYNTHMAYGAISSSSCASRYIVDNGGAAMTPTVNTSLGSYYNTTSNIYQSFQSFEEQGSANASTPATSITATSTNLCKGACTTLKKVGGSLGFGASWMWYEGSCGSSAFLSTVDSVVVCPQVTTTYYVRAESPCGGNTTCVSITITVGDTSSAPIDANASPSVICPGGSSALTINGGTLGAGASWHWYSGSCGGTSIDTGATVTVTPTVTTTYYVRAEGTCNTTACVSVTVNVSNIGVSAAWNMPTSICENEAALNLSSYVTGTSGGTFSGTGVSGNSFNPTGLGSQVIPIKYSVGSGTCVKDSTIQILVKIAPKASWTAPATICNSQSVVNLNSLVDVGSTTGGTWFGTGVSGNTFDPSGLPIGNVVISYVVSNNGCTDSVAHTISIVNGVSAAWNMGSICENIGVLNLATYVIGTAGGTFTGSGVTGNNFDPAGLGGQVIPIKYSVGSGTCAKDSTIQVVVKEAPIAAWTAPVATCTNQSAIDLATLLNVGSSTFGLWFGTGVTGTIFDPTGITQPSVTISYVVDDKGCKDSVAHTITILQADTIDESQVVITNTQCGQTNGSIYGIKPQSVTINYAWYNSNNQLISTNDSLQNVGVGTYHLVIANLNGCKDTSDSYTIVSPSALQAQITATPMEGNAPLLVSFNGLPQGAASYTWNFGDSTALVVLQNTTHTYYKEGNYSVILTIKDNLGCEDTAMVIIKVKDEFKYEIPNVFSPNNDGINDVFVVKASGTKEIMYRIYNRWGLLLFEGLGGWDGRTNAGVDSKAGTFFYVIDITDKKDSKYGPFKGAITLVK